MTQVGEVVGAALEERVAGLADMAVRVEGQTPGGWLVQMVGGEEGVVGSLAALTE